MVFRRSTLLTFLFPFTVRANTSEFRDSLDLAQYLANPVSLNGLIIQYTDSTAKVLFVFGDGKVVRQTTVPGDLVPTCKGRVKQDRIRELLRGFIDHHFFDLPQKSYLVILAGDNPWTEMKLHSIIFDDGIGHAQRTFAYGTYAGKTEPVPVDFSESEKLLRQLEGEAISSQPCGVSQRIEIPKVDVAPSSPNQQHQM